MSCIYMRCLEWKSNEIATKKENLRIVEGGNEFGYQPLQGWWVGRLVVMCPVKGAYQSPSSVAMVGECSSTWYFVHLGGG